MDAFHALEARLRERVGVLFDCARPDAKSLSDAEVWLREFSKSEEAWVVVVRVLERPDANATEAMAPANSPRTAMGRASSMKSPRRTRNPITGNGIPVSRNNHAA